MLRFLVLVLLMFAIAAVLGCDRTNADVERERQLAKTEERQKVAAAQLAEKERALADRQAELQKTEADRLRVKELELLKREAELGTAQGARQSKSEPTAKLTTVAVQLRVNMTRPDGKSWDTAGGAPDPELTLQSSSGTSMKQAFSNTLTPAASFKVKLTAGDTVTVTGVDKDALNASDPMGSFSVKYPGRAAVHSGDMGAARITVSFSE